MKKIFCGIIVAALASSACRKKEEPANPIQLSAPVAAGNSSNPQSTINPGGEAAASNGPIQLTLRLQKKVIKAKRPPLDTPILAQIELKNIGNNKILIQDEMFYRPGPIRDASESYRSGIFVEILDSHDRPVKLSRLWTDVVEDENTGVSASTPEQAAEAKKKAALVAGWRKQGFTFTEIRDRLLDYERSHPGRDDAQKWEHRYNDPHAHLLPGQSTTTVAWAHLPLVGAQQGGSIGQFTELNSYDLEQGQYRIRAVYNYAPTERLKRMKNIFPPGETDVRVETPYIQFEVVR
jgi:hypothetical protein